MNMAIPGFLSTVSSSVSWIGGRVPVFLAVVDDLVRTIDTDQERVQIEIVEMGRTAADLLQQIGTPDHLVEGLRPDLGQHLAHFLRIEGDQVHDLVG